jgi:PhnB protein
MVARSMTPMLTVTDASAAVEFYRRAFGAAEGSRLQTPTGHVVAQMFVDGLEFYVVDENPDAFNLSPEALGGTSVRISLIGRSGWSDRSCDRRGCHRGVPRR